MGNRPDVIITDCMESLQHVVSNAEHKAVTVVQATVNECLNDCLTVAFSVIGLAIGRSCRSWIYNVCRTDGTMTTLGLAATADSCPRRLLGLVLSHKLEQTPSRLCA